MKITIAKIWWEDSALHGQETKWPADIAKLELVEVFSCGAVVKKNKKGITLAMDYFSLEKSCRSQSTISRACIRKVEYEVVEV